MDLYYLADHIKEELEGSKDYIMRALELKPMTETWSKKLYEMSMEEHKHATNLYQMFNEYCLKMSASMNDMPEYARSLKDEIVDVYAECTSKIKAMWELYKV